jgi:hypothetical protein
MDEIPKTEPDGTPRTYSIALRLRRTTHEDVYVSVPVTAAITEERPDGTRGINFDALVAQGVQISQDPKAEWKVESALTECHPIQQRPPDDRSSVCPLFDKPITREKRG